MNQLPETLQRSLKEILETEQEVIIVKLSGNELGTSYKVQHRNLHLFVKCYDATTCVKSVEVYFKNELVFYGDILKAFGDLNEQNSRESSGSSWAIPAAKCYATVIDPQELSFIVLDNILVQGFKPFSVNTSLTLEQAREVLKSLGHFHAFSLALGDQNPVLFEQITSQLTETVFHRDLEATNGRIFRKNIADALKLAKQSFPKGSEYVSKLGEYSLDIYSGMCRLLHATNLKVVTHGDLWSNNILTQNNNFRSIDNNIRSTDKNIRSIDNNVLFIDYQGCRVSSPIHDLMQVLLVSLSQHIRDNYREELLQIYHRSLCDKLQDLGSDAQVIFPYELLEQELEKQTKFVLATALAGLPIYMDEGTGASRLSDSDSVSSDSDTGGAASGEGATNVTLEEYIEGISRRKSMKCKSKMLEIIIDVVDQGYLD